AFTTIRTNLNVNFIVTTVVKSTLEHLYILIGDRIKSNDEIPINLNMTRAHDRVIDTYGRVQRSSNGIY
ncbi:hypothetical protein BLOT_005443, partial [Blomia tropicalis]